MNALVKETNVQSSLKKYFVDALGEKVTFDVSLASPNIRKQGADAIKQWYNVSFGQFGRQALAEYTLEMFCLSRQDFEGIELAKMSDVLIDLLLDSTISDGMRRISLFDVSTTPWTQIGAMVVQDINEAPVFTLAEDETKIKIYSMRLRWGAKI